MGKQRSSESSANIADEIQTGYSSYTLTVSCFTKPAITSVNNPGALIIQFVIDQVQDIGPWFFVRHVGNSVLPVHFHLHFLDATTTMTTTTTQTTTISKNTNLYPGKRLNGADSYEVSEFRRGVDEVFALLGWYAAHGGSCLPTFGTAWSLKMWLIACPETQGSNCQHTQHNNPEKQRPQRVDSFLNIWSTQLVKKFLDSKEPESSLPCSQKPLTGLHPERFVTK